MARMRVTTYKDVIGHLVDYLGGATDEATERYARRAIQMAYADLANARRWSYFYQRGRITTSATQTSSTVAYDHSGGAYERMVTIAAGTWPAWAAYGSIVIDNVPYEVDARKSSTVLTLTPSSNPGDDVAAGTSYTLYRDTYPLPIDFVAMDGILNVSNGTIVRSEHPKDWLDGQWTFQSGSPNFATVTGDPNYFGALALRFQPAPDQAYVLDFIYQRRPRQLNRVEYSDGTASITSGSTTVTGAGTTWTSDMVGGIMRFSASGTTDTPTGQGGTAPAAVERVITGFVSATSVTLDADPAQTISGASYAISDPVDLEEGAMLNYFLRLCEKQMRDIRRVKPLETEPPALRMAEILAFEADARNFEQQAVGDYGFGFRRLASYPLGSDLG